MTRIRRSRIITSPIQIIFFAFVLIYLYSIKKYDYFLEFSFMIKILLQFDYINFNDTYGEKNKIII